MLRTSAALAIIAGCASAVEPPAALPATSQQASASIAPDAGATGEECNLAAPACAPGQSCCPVFLGVQQPCVTDGGPPYGGCGQCCLFKVECVPASPQTGGCPPNPG